MGPLDLGPQKTRDFVSASKVMSSALRIREVRQREGRAVRQMERRERREKQRE